MEGWDEHRGILSVNLEAVGGGGEREPWKGIEGARKRKPRGDLPFLYRSLSPQEDREQMGGEGGRNF